MRCSSSLSEVFKETLKGGLEKESDTFYRSLSSEEGLTLNMIDAAAVKNFEDPPVNAVIHGNHQIHSRVISAKMNPRVWFMSVERNIEFGVGLKRR